MKRKPLAEKHNSEPHKMESISKTSYWLLTLVIYLCVAANGFIDNMRSVTYPDIMQELHLDHVHYGMLQSLGQFSYLIWALLAAFSMPHIGFKATFSVSLVITIIGSVLTIFTSNFWLLMFIQLLATCSNGVLDDGPSSLAVYLFTKYPAVMFCIMSGIYGFGAFVAPIFASFILKCIKGSNYKQIYLWMNIPLAAVLVFMLCVRFAVQKPKTNPEEKKSVLHYMRSPLIWYCAILLNFLATAERGTLSWGTLYVEEVLHLDPEVGARLSSQFYFIFMCARIAGGFIADWIGPFLMEYIIIPLGIVVYVVGFLLGKNGLYVLPFTGLFVSLYWPTMVICCRRYWKDEVSIPISCMLPLQSVAGMIIQYSLGYMNDKWGPQYAYWMSVPAAVIGYLMFIGFDFICKRKEEKEIKQPLIENVDVAFSVCCYRSYSYEITLGSR